MKTFTTAIDYVNAAPHLGHAYEKIATDVLARFWRLKGEPVFFLTGTDEHGTKVEKSSAARNITPKVFTDEISTQFRAAWQSLDIAYDRFIRTTDPEHATVVKEIWRRMHAKGDLYKASYEGLYCPGCETFLNERDLDPQADEPQCKLHPKTAIDRVAEENWFFKLSAYKQRLLDYFEAHPDFVLPAFRRAEALKMLEELVDISVSRSTRAVTWGIQVPDDENQVIYVWIDALSNYLTGTGFMQDDAQFSQQWPATSHIIGKDILRFHAIYWPAMLMSADLPLPGNVFAHGFITVNAEKISKSSGNTLAPQDLMDRFALPNADAVRYYLMASTPFGQDGNFAEEEFKLKINADLANNLGNLLNRTVSMLGKYFGGQVPQVAVEPLGSADWVTRAGDAYARMAFHEACEIILGQVDAANKLINDAEPWTLYKGLQAGDEASAARLQAVMTTVATTLAQAAIALSPVTPRLSQGIWQQLGLSRHWPFSAAATWPKLENACDKGSNWFMQQSVTVDPQGPLLPRLDSELLGAAGKKN
ncbi:MAG: methionine--tRNA ligase [Vampirovibrionales bacterium]|nr:methionine--tRNA ligase [Vampirovibrionales bacterium]